MFWNKYPYTDFHEMNLDWILARMMELHHDWDEFKALNEIINDGEWSITNNYRQWTVVSYNNAGYISLKPVPAGIDISNTEYWGLIADYNILIEDLTDRIEALEHDVEDIQDDISPLLNPYYIFLTDSYGGRVNGDGKTYIDLIVAELHLDASEYIHVSVAGAGFTQPHGDTKEFDYILMNSIPAADRERVTKIFVFAGANDIGASDTVTAIQNGMNYFMYDVRDYFPNAEAYFACIGNEIDAVSSQEYRQTMTLPAYQRCGVLGAHYIANAEFILSDNTFFENDGIHPNAYGVDALGRHLVGGVIDGECDVLYNFETSINTFKTPDGTTHSNVSVKQHRFNDTFRHVYRKDAFSFVLSSHSVTMNFNWVVGSLTLPRTVIQPDARTQYQYTRTGICIVETSGGNYAVPILILLTGYTATGGAVFDIRYCTNQTFSNVICYTYHFNLD